MADVHLCQNKGAAYHHSPLYGLSFIGDSRYLMAVITGIVTVLGLSALGLTDSPHIIATRASSLLSLSLFQPVLEELLFRGIIQGRINLSASGQKSLAGISVANFCTSLLFVAVHFLHHPPVWALTVFIPSLVFGFCRDRYGSLLPSITLHCFYNWLFFTL